MEKTFSIDEIPDVYYLEAPEQLKALAEPMRYRMCRALAKPMTCAALARQFKITRPKAHYHLKKLESVGLVRPYSEVMVNGIVEKYFVIVGRVLDFSNLVLKTDGAMSADLIADTVGAISGFLASMLEVSRENALAASESHARGDAYFFDFASVLTRDQYQMVKARLVELRSDVIALSHENLAGRQNGQDMMAFSLSSYLSPKKDNGDAQD